MHPAASQGANSDSAGRSRNAKTNSRRAGSEYSRVRSVRQSDKKGLQLRSRGRRRYFVCLPPRLYHNNRLGGPERFHLQHRKILDDDGSMTPTDPVLEASVHLLPGRFCVCWPTLSLSSRPRLVAAALTVVESVVTLPKNWGYYSVSQRTRRDAPVAGILPVLLILIGSPSLTLLELFAGNQTTSCGNRLKRLVSAWRLDT
jgi:hypothetical protein